MKVNGEKHPQATVDRPSEERVSAEITHKETNSTIAHEHGSDLTHNPPGNDAADQATRDPTGDHDGFQPVREHRQRQRTRNGRGRRDTQPEHGPKMADDLSAKISTEPLKQPDRPSKIRCLAIAKPKGPSSPQELHQPQPPVKPPEVSRAQDSDPIHSGSDPTQTQLSNHLIGGQRTFPQRPPFKQKRAQQHLVNHPASRAAPILQNQTLNARDTSRRWISL